jgi:hypothetical protein
MDLKKKKRKEIDFRNDTRNTGIPRNYFILNGNAVNSTSSLKEIKDIIRPPNPRAGRPVELINSPERASAIIFGDQVSRKTTAQVCKDKEFRRFITEGPRITHSSFEENSCERAVNHSRRLLLPSHNKDLMLHKLQRDKL